MISPQASVANLEQLREDFDAYGRGGFYDAIAVGSGTVSKRYLSLDQGMIMAALGNALTGDNLRDYVSEGALEDRVRPLMEMEEFGAQPTFMPPVPPIPPGPPPPVPPQPPAPPPLGMPPEG